MEMRQMSLLQKRNKVTFAFMQVKNAYRICRVILVCLVGLPLFLVSAPQAAPQKNLAAWVVRRHMDSQAEIKQICAEAHASGYTTLLVQVRGRADAYYRSDLVPRAEELSQTPPDFDPLAAMMQQCPDQCIQAWLNVYYLWSGQAPPKNKKHPALADHGWLLADRNGKSVSDYSELEQSQHWIEGIYADPSSSRFRDYFVAVVAELVQQYPVAGIHLDFVRYPGSFFGLGEIADEFTNAYGFDPRLLPEKINEADVEKWYRGQLSAGDELLTTAALLWADLRAGEVTKLVRRVKNTLRQSPHTPLLSAAVFPDLIPAYLDKGQDWLTWAQEGIVDEIMPMAYFGGAERVKRQLENVVDRSGATPVRIWAGLGAYIKSPEEIARETENISELGLHGISFFSLGHLLRQDDKSAAYRKKMVFPRRNGCGATTSKAAQQTMTTEHIIRNLQKIRGMKKNEMNKAVDQRISARIEDFHQSCRTIIPLALKELEQNTVMSPFRLDLHGIFRYIHPYDSAEKKQAQENLCREARELMLTDGNMDLISKKFSQAGSRQFQSLLPRRYLDMNQEKDRELAGLHEGEVSRVFQEEDGCWTYKIRATGTAGEKKFEELDWAAKRIVFSNKIREVAIREKAMKSEIRSNNKNGW